MAGHFTKFSGNPVVKQITPGNRDPKVIWHEPTKKWVMTLYVETNKVQHTIHFLTSPNLKDWTLSSARRMASFECPDFFELPVDGDRREQKWVLTAASSEYMVGTFDGTNFTPGNAKTARPPRTRLLRGADLQRHPGEATAAASRSAGSRPKRKGMPFNQSMTIPLELKLITTPEGPRLTWTPVKELAVVARQVAPVRP